MTHLETFIETFVCIKVVKLIIYTKVERITYHFIEVFDSLSRSKRVVREIRINSVTLNP